MNRPKYGTYNEFKKECRRELDAILLKQTRLHNKTNKSRTITDNSSEEHKEPAVQISN